MCLCLAIIDRKVAMIENTEKSINTQDGKNVFGTVCLTVKLSQLAITDRKKCQLAIIERKYDFS